MVDDPEDVLTDRNMRPNKESPEDVASWVSSANATNDRLGLALYRRGFHVETVLLGGVIAASSKVLLIRRGYHNPKILNMGKTQTNKHSNITVPKNMCFVFSL